MKATERHAERNNHTDRNRTTNKKITKTRDETKQNNDKTKVETVFTEIGWEYPKKTVSSVFWGTSLVVFQQPGKSQVLQSFRFRFFCMLFSDRFRAVFALLSDRFRSFLDGFASISDCFRSLSDGFK